MRWSKHMSDLRNDEQVAEYLDTCRDRHSGYGFLMTLFEVVAAALDKGCTRAVAAYSLASWCRLCATKPTAIRHKLDTLREAGVINTESVGNSIEIEIPKLLIWRDEYSRKSGATPDTVRTMSCQRESEETETDTEKEAEREVDPLALAKMDFSIGRSPRSRSQEVEKSLGDKVDQLLTNTRALFENQNGELDIFKLARTINQRDGKKSAEPSPAFVKAVANCVQIHLQKRIA